MMIRHRFDYEHNLVKIIRRFSSLSDTNQPHPTLKHAVSEFPLHLLDEATKLRLADRHTGIICHPDSISRTILPYDQILKTNSKTGSVRLMDVERSYGYFWTLTDLKKNSNKPIMSNPTLIPMETAKMFPCLGKVHGKIKPIIDPYTSTNGDHNMTLPNYFTRMNRSKDPAIECTLVTVTFNDFGYQMIPSWVHPFKQAFHKRKNDDWTNRTKMYQLVIHEGRILSFFESMIIRSFRKQTPIDNQSSILLYFTRGGNDDEEYQAFRDVLRMHNNKTAYIFLLDGIGRVRFAASGQPNSPDEIQLLIEHTKTLVPSLR